MRTITKATTGGDASGATLDSITYYIKNLSSGPYNIIWGLYDDDSGPNDSVCTQTSGESVSSGDNWTKTVTAFDAHSLNASTIYWFANLNTCTISSDFSLAADETPGVVWQHYHSSYDYNDYPNLPASLSGSTPQEYRCSIYGTYSTEEPPEAEGLRRRREERRR